MCGIAGIVDFNRPISPDALAPMLDVIEHRGPDDSGRFDADGFSIGMRRLSIIDLEGGHQPLFNETGKIGVVMNGELYNYIELRDELKAKGHRFKTESDTEVAVHLYEEYGADFPNRLNGMFGMAIWDVEKRCISLIRDPLGIKPLYWVYEAGRLVFASEMKSLLKGPVHIDEINRDALAAYIHLGYVPREQTIFSRIQKLPPGHSLTCSPGREPRISAYWSLKDAFNASAPRPEEEVIEEARALLDDAVRIRLRSDVKVGTFLSGGMDSSAITQLASSRQKGIDSFGIKFENHYFDESEYARLLAKHAGTVHHELTVEPVSLVDRLQELAWFADEPNWDPALLPSYIICKYAREHVKVALSGLGGDELFAGYRRHWEKQRMVSTAYKLRKYLPAGLRRLCADGLGFFNPNLGRKLRRKLVPENHLLAFSYGVRMGDENIIQNVAPWAGQAFAVTEWISKVFDEVSINDPLNQRLYYDSTTYLPDQILSMVDRTSMAVSLEVRVPFLDKRLVGLMAGVQGAMKTEPEEGKVILKKMLRGLVPDRVLDRPKLGFGAPVRRWVMEPKVEELLRTLPTGQLAGESIIEGRAVERLIDQPELREAHCGFLWTLLMLECWMNRYR